MRGAALAALAAAAIALAPATARADDAETLARVAVLEAGFSAERDHAAIWHVLSRRAARAGWSIERMAVAYSSPMRRGRWPAWAENAPDSAWRRVLARAAAFLAGDVGDPCGGRAIHWGDRAGDAIRAQRAGWLLATCGETRNAFWMVR